MQVNLMNTRYWCYQPDRNMYHEYEVLVLPN